MRRRIIAMLLSLAMIVGYMPAIAFAAETGWSYNSDGNTVQAWQIDSSKTEYIKLYAPNMEYTGHAYDKAYIETSSGWSQNVGLVINKDDISYYDNEGHSIAANEVVEPGYYTAKVYVGSKIAQASFRITSASSHTVTFDTDGGNKMDSVTVANNAKLARPVENPVKANYVFAGWLKGDAPYDFNTPVTEDVTITAKWDRADYKVTLHGGDHIIALDDNGHPVKYRDKAMKNGEAFAKTYRDYNADAEKAWYEQQNPGYEFLGWYTDEEFTNRYNFNDPVYCNIDLYAKFTAKNVTASFDTDGGNKVSSIDVPYKGKLAEDKVPMPEKENYVFKGWFTDEECTNAYDFNTTLDKDITLYAAWARADYKVTLHGGKFVIALNELGQPIKYRDKTIQEGASFAKTYRDYNAESEKAWYEAQNPGYEFLGWFTDEECTERYNFNDAVYSNIDLYAKFVADTVTVSFDSNGGSKVSSIDVPYDGKLDEYTVPEPVKENYVFKGWFTDKDCTVEFDFNTNLTKDSTLYAAWARADYKVTLHGGKFIIALNDLGQKVSYRVKTIEDGASFAETYRDYNADAEKAWYEAQNPGYEFLGWYTDEECTERYDFHEPIYSNLNLYAKFESKEYLIKYNPDNVLSKEKMADVEVGFNDKDYLSTNLFTRKGYKFMGWSTKKNSEHAMIEDYETAKYSFKMIADLDETDAVTYDSKVATLYAVWAPIKYIVKYDGNGATVDNYKTKVQAINYNDSTKEVDESYNTLWGVQFEKVGYEFTGWNTEADGSGISLKNKEVLGVDYLQGYVLQNTNITDEDGASITLYAQWKALNYPIIFNANDGTSKFDTQWMTYDKEGALKGLSFNRTGYYFKGWSLTPDGPVVFENGQTVKNVCTGDWCVLGCKHPEKKFLVLYAQWEAYDNMLIATAKSTGRTAIVSWDEVTGATSYDVYGAKCGKTMTYLGSTEGTSFSVSKIGKKKLAKRGRYKFYVVAHVGDETIRSILCHTICNNYWKKYGNVLSVNAGVDKINLKTGNTEVLNATEKVYKNKKCLNVTHDPKFRYITSDSKVATVDEDGVITAVGPGTCYVYVQAINGVYDRVKVVVDGVYFMWPDFF